MTNPDGIAVAILAGGRSRRMGTDKARLPARGGGLLECAARAAAETGLPVRVVGRERPSDWPADLDAVGFLPDETPGLGPIGGLATALRHAPIVLALACDMPKITAAALVWLVEHASGQIGEDGLVVRNGERSEPLFSVYTAACLPRIERQVQQGRRSLHALIASGDFAVADAPAEVAQTLLNVNTPEEWAAAAA